MHKKGDLDLSLKAIIGIVFGIIFLLIIFPLIENVYDMLISEEKDDSASFTEFVNRINSLKDNEKSEISIYVTNDHCFMAFNKNQQELNNIKRGINCNINKVCLCRCLKQSSELIYQCENCIALDLGSISFEPICGKQELILSLERKSDSVTIIPK
ncbi:MAG: hypothetical protein V1815_01630 [Candidatus Woesearchaeota archaeon]